MSQTARPAILSGYWKEHPMENDSVSAFESPAKAPSEDGGEDLLPAHIEIIKEQQARLYMDGGEIVATGNVLVPDRSIVALRPFPKSKTGFTLEFRFATSGRPGPTSLLTCDHLTSTYRHTFLDYEGMVLAPCKLAVYRGRNVMGILHGRI